MVYRFHRYAEKVEDISNRILDLMMKYTQPNIHEEEFNVINHGDCWVNNMLFKYDANGKPIKHIFVSVTLKNKLTVRFIRFRNLI